MKVLLHVSNLDQIKRMENNVNNLLKENSNIKISVVANDQAVKMFVLGKDNTATINSSAKYYVCNNSIRSLKLDDMKLISGAEVTSSGVFKIANLQNEGYLYIKV